MPTTDEQKKLTSFAFREYKKYFSDGKYFTHNNNLTVCQSKATYAELLEDVLPLSLNPGITKINPLGLWMEKDENGDYAPDWDLTWFWKVGNSPEDYFYYEQDSFEVSLYNLINLIGGEDESERN